MFYMLTIRNVTFPRNAELIAIDATERTSQFWKKNRNIVVFHAANFGQKMQPNEKRYTFAIL